MRIERSAWPAAAELNELLLTHRWEIDPPERLERSLRAAWGCVTARDGDGRLVGFVQLLSDGIRHAYVLRMIVHPDHRRHGVGSRIMQEVMAWLEEERLLPTLVATPGNERFYERFGFKPEDRGFAAMCIRTPFWK